MLNNYIKLISYLQTTQKYNNDAFQSLPVVINFLFQLVL